MNYRVWKDLSLNDDLEEEERAQLAVWDYPISDRFTKIWAAMTEANAYMGYNDAIFKVRASRHDGREGNALVGMLFTLKILSSFYFFSFILFLSLSLFLFYPHTYRSFIF